MYDFLKTKTAPRHLVVGVSLLGTKEKAGAENNPVILSWAKELKLSQYTADSIPWCGLFVAYCMYKADRDPVASPLWARSWANFGIKVGVAMFGDVLVFSRKGGGHVGFYVAEDKECYHVLGGNQGDAVSVVRIKKDRCIAIRRPKYNNTPADVKCIFLSSNGSISTDEA